MANMNINFDQLSSEEKRKADVLMEVEYAMQQVGYGHISLNEGYDQLIKLMGAREIEQILKIQSPHS
jgi:hypothetical protein